MKILSRNSKQYRSMPIKRNNDDTDSDDVFNEVRKYFYQKFFIFQIEIP
jgi:hypothetical protein